MDLFDRGVNNAHAVKQTILLRESVVYESFIVRNCSIEYLKHKGLWECGEDVCWQEEYSTKRKRSTMAWQKA